jgi:hypothetical protein
MSQVYFSTVHRGAPPEQSGEFVRVDWASKTVVASLPVQSMSDDPNPRGGTRGGRGVWVEGDTVYAATHHRIDRLTLDLAPDGVVASGRPLADVHELFLNDGTLWCAATHTDKAVGIALAGGVPTQLAWTGKRPAHLNAVATWDGHVVALLGRPGLVVDLEQGTQLASVQPRSHNLIVSGGSAFVTVTATTEVVEMQLPSGRLIRSLSLRSFPWVAQLEQTVMGSALSSPLFARGLALSGDRLYVGIGPASIVCVDWPSGEMVDAFQFSDDVNVVIHGLHVTED